MSTSPAPLINAVFQIPHLIILSYETKIYMRLFASTFTFFSSSINKVWRVEVLLSSMLQSFLGNAGCVYICAVGDSPEPVVIDKCCTCMLS